MSITKKVAILVNEKKAGYVNDKNLQEATRLYEELKGQGLLRQPSYDIPPLDTIGKHLVKASTKREAQPA